MIGEAIVLIFIVIVVVAIILVAVRNAEALLRLDFLRNESPATQYVAAMPDMATRQEINKLPLITLPDNLQYCGVVGAAHTYSEVGAAVPSVPRYKLYPLCCNMCRARAIYWMRKHEELAGLGVLAPVKFSACTARPASCFAQRHFSDDCDPVRRFVVAEYSARPLDCGWAAQHPSEIAGASAAAARYGISSVLENCAITDAGLRLLHADMQRYPKTSALDEWIEEHGK